MNTHDLYLLLSGIGIGIYLAFAAVIGAAMWDDRPRRSTASED
jgi:hypothetical protein